MSLKNEIAGQQLVVTVDGAPRPDIHCLHVHRSVGGQRPMEAVCAFVLADGGQTPKGTAGRGDLLHDLVLRQDLQRRVLRVYQVNAAGQRNLIHVGHAVELDPALSDREVRYGFVSRITNEHFGQPLRGPLLRNRAASGLITTFVADEPVVFNPDSEGLIWGNRSNNRFGPRQAAYWDDPRRSRSRAARLWQQEPLQLSTWDLADAVHSLCWTLNLDETWIENPQGSAIDLRRQLGKIDLRNVTVPRFKFLNEILDGLLPAYGCNWYLEFNGPAPRIVLYKLGAGHAQVEIKHQRAKQILDLAKTNVEEFALRYAVDRNLVNYLGALAHPVHVEATYPLVRCWKPAYDTLDSQTDLVLGKDGLTDNPDYQNVGRRWALNEAGDYVGLRPEIRTPFDWTTIRAKIGRAGGPQVPIAKYFSVRRRRFLPTLALDPDGKDAGPIQGIKIEITTDGGATWTDLTKLESGATEDYGQVPPTHVLQDECGIFFYGMHVPQALFKAGGDAGVRVVATVEADAGDLYAKDSTKTSVNRAYAAAALLDGREKFKVRVIDESSAYYDEVRNGTRQSLEVNELGKLKTLVDELADRWNRADCSGPITIPGLEADGFELSWVVPRIRDRAIELQTHHQQQRWPQVVAIDYDAGSQSITLQLDTPREDVTL